MSFIDHQWDDPAGMAAGLGRRGSRAVSIGSTFGGSPQWRFVACVGVRFPAITTRGESAPENTRRYQGPLAFDQPHNMVYRVVPHPTNGALAVWLDGSEFSTFMVLRSAPAMRHDWSIGCYYAGYYLPGGSGVW